MFSLYYHIHSVLRFTVACLNSFLKLPGLFWLNVYSFRVANALKILCETFITVPTMLPTTATRQMTTINSTAPSRPLSAISQATTVTESIVLQYLSFEWFLRIFPSILLLRVPSSRVKNNGDAWLNCGNDFNELFSILSLLRTLQLLHFSRNDEFTVLWFMFVFCVTFFNE